MAQLDLSDIGRSADLFQTGRASPLTRFLFNWAMEMAYRLRDAAPKATGGLGQSAAPNAKSEDKAVAVQIEMDEYWDFVNEGVDGTQRSFGSPYKFTQSTKVAGIFHGLSESMWIATKSLHPEPGQTIDEMNWAIAQGVKKGGIEPTYFFENIMTDEVIDQLQRQLLDEFGRALLEKTFDNL